MVRFLFIVLLVTGFAQRVPAQDLGVLERFIEESRVQWNVPGVAVSIVQGDKVIFLKGFGVRKIDQPGLVDKDTIFQLASVSKTFVAAGLGVAVDRGLVKWDDEIIKNLPQFALKDPYPSRFASARDLLAHRTGLPAFIGDLLGKIGYSPQEILYKVRFIDPATSFRNKANYSNLGFFIAGELLGSLFKSSWEAAVSTLLLVPCEMKKSGFAKNLDNPNVAFAHAFVDKKMKVIPWDRTGGFPAAGAITSTVEDMAQWMVMHLNGGLFKGKQILKSTTIEEIFSPSMVAEISFSEAPPLNKNSSFSFGLGWGNYDYKGSRIIEKGGGLDGMRSNVTLIPELKLGICILCNRNLTFLPEAIRAKFLELYLGPGQPTVQADIKTMEKSLENIFEIPPKPQNALPPSHALELYTGTFENILYGAMTIKIEGNGLILEAGPARWKGTLTPWSNETFTLQWPVINTGNEQITFTFGPDNHAIEIQTETLGTFKKKN